MLYGRCVCSSGEGAVRLSVLTVSEMDVCIYCRQLYL